ncbi:restriction endonuclease subunit S [Emticicia sp. 21SJ11W-3]|uniref:restriction endonuclease subunit S n=1 Tax=Emticicia sp. 21SJ11W-3 TaxID=2916755 RepID=UPI00209E587E|nr:restriction endonuclease subunit S [Emticicia sp. 21SJ11W-3]UTA67893.1 restriction endonuclease subunit S [Emticicia sp. 21SJ11W-3]
MTKLQPQLRFPEFEGDWNEQNLGNTVKINQGLQIPISERYTKQIEGSHFYITNEFLREGNLKKYYIKNPSNSVLCTKEDILMTRTGNTGMVVTNVEGAFHNNFFKIAYPNYIRKQYLFYFLNLLKTQTQILKLAGTSTIPDLNHGDFYRIKIQLPTFEEQTKIANFLTAIDEKIQALQKKKSLLEQYKKGVMQKIFSQELRFKQDDGSDFPDWEEKTLGEMGEAYNGLTGKTKESFGIGKPYIQYKQIFDNSKINTKNFDFVKIGENENQSKVIFGDVFFTVSSETPNEIGYSSVLLDMVDDDLYLNSFCFGYRPFSLKILYPYFAQFLFRSEHFRTKIIKLAQGSTRYNMSKVQLMKLTIQLPSFEEQHKISNFLSGIDEKINKVSQQIEYTQTYKKGLLQQMFC